MHDEPDPRFARRSGRPSPGWTNGAHHNSPRARPVPLADHANGQLDLVAVQADDELINALASGMTVSSPGVGGYDADDQVAALLAAWRADVDAEPIPDLIDLDRAVDTVRGASAAARPPARRRYLVPVAAAAAMIVISVGGLSLGAQSAQPGDALWSVARVVDSQRVESVEARQRVEGRIAEARVALESGNPDRAAEVLASVGSDLEAVRAEEGLAELVDVQTFLLAKADEATPGIPVQLAAPLRSDPTRPVPPAVVSPTPTLPLTSLPGGTVPPPAGSTSGSTSSESGGSAEIAPGATTPGEGGGPATGEGSTDATTSPTAPSETDSPTPEGDEDPSTDADEPTTSATATAEGARDGSSSESVQTYGISSVQSEETPTAGEPTSAR